MKYLNLLFFCLSFSLISQNTSIDNDLFEGNEKVKKENYIGAEMDYRLALTKAPQTPKALFNLGNTQYQANAYDEAAQQFFRTQKFADNKLDKHAALHNMGNVYMKKKEYKKAVESYKNALRNNPLDDETRYNYALAKSLLEDEKKNQENDDQDKNDQNKDNKENKEKDQKEEDDNGDENKEENGDKSDENKKENDQLKDEKKKDSDKKNSNKNRKPGQLSPEQVKSLLEAMSNQEKKVQDKINAKKVKGKLVKTKKDW